MNIVSLFKNFQYYLISERNCSETTIYAYQSDFNHLMSFLDSKGYSYELHELKTAILREYIIYLKTIKKFHTNTIRRKIHSLSSFFKYLLENEYIDKNPMLPIHAPKEEQKLPIYLQDFELKLLLEAPEKFARFASHINRDKAMIALFIYTGARRSEVINLNWNDINFGTRQITIRKGKGNKTRNIPLVSPLDEYLWTYLNERLPLRNNALLITDNFNRMSKSNIHSLISRYIKLSGLDGKGYSIHKLRHSFATLLYQKGVDILAIKELLGHEDLNTTNIYTHTSSEHLRKSVEKLVL